MFCFAYGYKCLLPPLAALQVAQQVLINSGFEIFDPVQPGKITTAGNHYGVGVMVTVVSMDSDGGSATVINAFTANPAAVPSAREMADAVLVAIQQS
ncbi:MAG: hypothetical protein ACKO4T_14780 [Planctomycetaceae bacterium]